METDELQARIQELTQLAETYLPLQKWGFVHKTGFVAKTNPGIIQSGPESRYSAVIYESPACRVKLSATERRWGYELSIDYGRRHAPDDEVVIQWEKEPCRCWHSSDLLFKFLDGVSPAEAVKMPYGISQAKDIFAESFPPYAEREKAPLRAIQFHAFAWEFYQPRLFQLLDVRFPDLWSPYAQFVKEYYEIYDPSELSKVC